MSFTTGDVIEIVTRTNNENEWWIGKLNGKQGQFPGMLPLPLADIDGCRVHLTSNLMNRKLCEASLEGRERGLFFS